MRALFDNNIFISYLLRPDTGVISSIVEAAVLGSFTFLVPREVLTEFSAAVAGKKYLSERITQHEAESFISIVRRIGEIIPTITQEFPTVTRDPKDDYLLAYAVVAGADYLVSGDSDLLSLGEVVGVKVGVQIVSPAAFLALLHEDAG